MKKGDMFLFNSWDCGLLHCTVTHAPIDGGVFFETMEDCPGSGQFTDFQLLELEDFIVPMGNESD